MQFPPCLKQLNSRLLLHTNRFLKIKQFRPIKNIEKKKRAGSVYKLNSGTMKKKLNIYYFIIDMTNAACA